MMEIERPEGLIKTLPTLYGDETQGRMNMDRTFRAIDDGLLDKFYIFLSGKPTKEVLYIYILIGGKIYVRANIASVDRIDQELDSWDGIKRKVKWIMTCTGPLSYPPSEVKWKGFQGIRYCKKLW